LEGYDVFDIYNDDLLDQKIKPQLPRSIFFDQLRCFQQNGYQLKEETIDQYSNELKHCVAYLQEILQETSKKKRGIQAFDNLTQQDKNQQEMVQATLTYMEHLRAVTRLRTYRVIDAQTFRAVQGMVGQDGGNTTSGALT
jgi:type I site-specific restriction endonuclease